MKKALVVVDMQNDFCPGGSLGIKDADKIIPVINRWIANFTVENSPIVFTRDWHPENHCSFISWPIHCVANTKGAEFHPEVKKPDTAIVITKADTPDNEAYSSFEGTELHSKLKSLGVEEVYVCGLATDYCVKNTAIDALKLGYKVILIEDGMKAVNISADDGKNAIAELEKKGASIINS